MALKTFCASLVRWLRPTNAIVTLVVLLACNACASRALRDAVNREFPPQNPVDHQVSAVKHSAAALAAFQEPPTILVSLAADDLQRLLPTSLAASIKAKSGEDIEIKAVDVRLGFGSQEVIVNADFSLKLPTEQSSVKGTAEIHCAAALERGSLVLRPSGGSMQLSSLVYRGSKAADLLVPAVTALLRTFLDNVNGTIPTQQLPLRFHFLRSLDLAQTLRSAPGVTDATGTVVTAGLALGSSAVLIEPSGVRVLASAVFLTQERFEEYVKLLEARVRMNDTSPLRSEELAALAACQDPAELARTINASDTQAVVAMCDAAEKGMTPIKTEHYPTTSEAYNELAASFPRYREGFLQKVQQIEPGARVLAEDSLVAISRTAVGSGLQLILSQASASANYHASLPDQSFNQLVTPTTTNLNCAANAGGCDSDFSYPGYNPRGCDSDCGLLDLDCHRRKLECEATKEAERLAYESAKAAAQVDWKIRKDLCEARKQIQKSGCELNQAWLDAWASKEIARLEGTASVSNLRAFGALDRIQVAPDLSSLAVDYRLGASATISANATVTPLNGGHLICVMPSNLSVTAQGAVSATTKTVTATQTLVTRDGDDLVMTYEISQQQVALSFDPPLPVALYQQNREKLFLACPAPVSIVNAITGFAGGLVGIEVVMALRPDLFDTTKTIDIPLLTLPLRIPAQELSLSAMPGVSARAIRLTPEWGQNALLFAAKVKR